MTISEGDSKTNNLAELFEQYSGEYPLDAVQTEWMDMKPEGEEIW